MSRSLIWYDDDMKYVDNYCYKLHCMHSYEFMEKSRDAI